jgi:hypothetical protein
MYLQLLLTFFKLAHYVFGKQTKNSCSVWMHLLCTLLKMLLRFTSKWWSQSEMLWWLNTSNTYKCSRNIMLRIHMKTSVFRCWLFNNVHKNVCYSIGISQVRKFWKRGEGNKNVDGFKWAPMFTKTALSWLSYHAVPEYFIHFIIPPKTT